MSDEFEKLIDYAGADFSGGVEFEAEITRRIMLESLDRALDALADYQEYARLCRRDNKTPVSLEQFAEANSDAQRTPPPSEGGDSPRAGDSHP